MHVRHAILQLFFGEAVKEDGKISVLVQPDFDFAMELLQVFGEQNPNLTIQHLFCMNNNEKMVSMRKNYNLSCLQKILPICACGCDYRARYYYDNVTARLNEFRLFPYLILTEHCALAFSADYQNALLFREETTLRMMREMFEGYFKQSEPLFERLDTVQSQLGYTETLIRHFIASDSPRYFFQRMPCLSGLLTAEMLERHLVKEMPGREQMIRAVAQYAKVMQTQVLDKKTTMFFQRMASKVSWTRAAWMSIQKSAILRWTLTSVLPDPPLSGAAGSRESSYDPGNERESRACAEYFGQCKRGLSSVPDADRAADLPQHPGTEHSYGILRLPGIHETGRTLHGRGDAGTCRSHSA